MQLTMRVDGVLVRQGLENLSAEIPQIGRRRIRTVTNRIVRQMQAYPPERKGQKYRRTGRMFYHWQIEQLDNGYVIRNTATKNGVQYAGYVVGDAYGAGQAWMHKGRWPVFRDIVDEEFAKLPGEIRDEIIMVARRNNLEAE